jgi:hypothetical protein
MDDDRAVGPCDLDPAVPVAEVARAVPEPVEREDDGAREIGGPGGRVEEIARSSASISSA